MEDMNARPGLLKQMNLSLLRRALQRRDSATRAELAADTGISSTTVRTLLCEMEQNGELEATGCDPSSGGRRAERYRLRSDRYCGAAFCLTGNTLHYLVTDLCGNILEGGPLPYGEDDLLGAICPCLDELLTRRELRSIGLGLPGIVEGDGYLYADGDGELHKVALGDTLAQKYGLSVTLENDLNAIAVGFGLCYEKQFPACESERTNMAFVHFEKGCVSAGLLADGQVIRGFSGYAGELSLALGTDGRTLSQTMDAPMDDVAYTRHVVGLLSWVCALLNPRYVALGGPAFRRECLGPIGDGLYALLPRAMPPEVLYAPDVWSDFLHGMAHLTARRIFDDVRLWGGQ